MNNHKIAWLACAASAALMLSGCASLPEGSKKPKIEITSVSVAQDQAQSGFNLEFTVRHDSLEPLEVRKIVAYVGVNGRQLASCEEEPEKMLITPRRDVKVKRFIPANLARTVEGESLKTPQFFGVADAAVAMYFTSDEAEDPFNPKAVYHGMLNNGGDVVRGAN